MWLDRSIDRPESKRQPARSPALERPLFENFEDNAAWAVYGDWLQQQADPYGERVALELQREGSKSEAKAKIIERIAKLDEQHRRVWLGSSLARLIEHEAFDGANLSWQRGFITSASVGTHAPILQALLESTAARFLRRLRIIPGENDQMHESIRALTEAGKLDALTHLDLSRGTLTDRGAQAILDAASTFARIERVDLSGNLISDEMCARLTKALPNVDVSGQRGGRDYSGLRASLAGKRVLWLDPRPQNNLLARRLMSSPGGEPRSGDRGNLVLITEVATAEVAAAALSTGHAFDLVLSHWGADQVADYHGERLANGPRLLAIMRREDLRVPVILFSTTTDVEARERTSLSLGARAYCFSQEALFSEIEAVFS